MAEDLNFRITVTDTGTAVVQKFGANVVKAGTQATAMGRTSSLAFAGVRQNVRGVLKSIISLRTAFVGLIAVAAVKKLVTTMSEFESRMLRVGAITGTVGGKFRELENIALRLGESTVFTAREAAGAMQFLAQAGFETNEIISATPKVLELAAAGMVDLATSADIVTNVMAGMGIEVENLSRANDILVTTFTSSNVNLQQLGLAFKFAGPIARAAGISFEEVATAIGLLGNAGIQGTLAGTSLKNAIARLLNPADKGAKIIKDLGLNIQDANGRMLPFSDILRQLGPIANDAGKIIALFGQRAGPGMAALLIQGSDAFDELSDKLKNSVGAAAAIAKRQMSGLTGAIKLMQSAFEGMVLSMQSKGSPAFIEIADGIRDIFLGLKDAITALSEVSTELARIEGIGAGKSLNAISIAGRTLILIVNGLRLAFIGVELTARIFFAAFVKGMSLVLDFVAGGIAFFHTFARVVEGVFRAVAGGAAVLASALFSLLDKLTLGVFSFFSKARKEMDDFADKQVELALRAREQTGAERELLSVRNDMNKVIETQLLAIGLNSLQMEELINQTKAGIAIFDALSETDKRTVRNARDVASAHGERTKAARKAAQAVKDLVAAQKQEVEFAASARGELLNLLLPLESFEERTKRISKALKKIPEAAALAIIESVRKLGLGVKAELRVIEGEITRFNNKVAFNVDNVFPVDDIEARAARVFTAIQAMPEQAGRDLVLSIKAISGLAFSEQVQQAEMQLEQFASFTEKKKEIFKDISKEMQATFEADARLDSMGRIETFRKQLTNITAAVEKFKAGRGLADFNLLPDADTLEQQAERIAKIFAKIPRAAAEAIISASSTVAGGIGAQMVSVQTGANTFIENQKAAADTFKKLDAGAIVRIEEEIAARNMGVLQAAAFRRSEGDRELVDEQRRATAKQAIVSGLGTLANNLMQSNSKKAFKVGKALRLADATMSAFGAIASALMAPFPLNLILTPIVAANAFFQVKQIAAMKFGGGGGGGGGGGVSLPSAGSMTGRAQIPDVPDGDGEGRRPQVFNITVAGFIGNEAELADQLGRLITEGREDGISFGLNTSG